MNRTISFLLSFLIAFQTNFALAKGKIQNEDVKSLAEIQAAVTTTGTLTSGSACVSSVGSLTGLSAGLFVYDTTVSTAIAAGTTITAIPGTCSAGQIQLSANAVASGSAQTLTFGGQASQLINDSKIWLAALTPSQTLSSAITTGSLGGGSGGSKNYLTSYKGNTGNGNFEFGNTTGFTLGHVALTNNFPSGTPTFGSGASGSLSLSVTSSSPIAGTYSGMYISSAATAAGDFVASNAYNIDLADQAKVSTFKFSYSIPSGLTNVNLSGTSANSYGVAIYDVTNAVFIQPAGTFNLVQGTGIGTAVGTFQTSSNGTAYRIVVYNANATAGAATLSLDDISVGPQSFNQTQIGVVGQIIATGSVTPPVGYLYANGSAVSRSQYADLFSVIGTTYGVGDGSTTFNLPNLQGVFARGAGTQTVGGITQAATLGATQGDQLQGHYHTGGSIYKYLGSGGTFSVSTIGGANDTNTSVGAPISDGTNGTPRTGTETHPANVAVAYHICYLKTAQASSDTDTRVVAISVNGSATFNGSSSAIQYPISATVDTHSAVASNQIIVPVSGYYAITGTQSNNVSGGQNNFNVSRNGSSIMGWQLNNNSGNGNRYTTSDVIKFNAGDVILFTGWQNSGSSAGQQMSFAMNKLSGPSTLLASDSVIEKWNTSVTSVVASGVGVVLYTNKIKSTHGAYNSSTGLFTAPISGTYLIAGTFTGNTVSGSNGLNYLYLEKNAGLDTLIGSCTSNTITTTLACSGSTLVSLNQGETASIAFYDNSAQTISASGTGSNTNSISIVRVGN